jgi:hypothetical protein
MSSETNESREVEDVPKVAVAALAVFLTLLWPLLLAHRGAPFEGFHRRELVMIAAGIVLWALVWSLSFIVGVDL